MPRAAQGPVRGEQKGDKGEWISWAHTSISLQHRSLPVFEALICLLRCRLAKSWRCARPSQVVAAPWSAVRFARALLYAYDDVYADVEGGRYVCFPPAAYVLAYNRTVRPSPTGLIPPIATSLAPHARL